MYSACIHGSTYIFIHSTSIHTMSTHTYRIAIKLEISSTQCMPASLASECWPYGDSRHAHADIASGNKHLHLVLLSPQVLGRYRGLECLSLEASLPNTQGSMILARVLRGLTCRPSAQGDRLHHSKPRKKQRIASAG